MCTKTKEEIDDLLKRAPDRESRRKILEELSACGDCEFGGAIEARLGGATCERHLVEFRNRVLHYLPQTCSKGELTNSAPNEPGNQ